MKWYQYINPKNWNVRDLTQDLLLMMGLPYGFGSTSLSRMQAMQLAAVYRCVDVKSDALSFPTKKVQIKTNRGWEDDPDDSLWSMLNLESNPTMTAPYMFKMMSVLTELQGNAYAEIIRDETFMPRQLKLILDYVKILIDGSGVLWYVVQGTNSPASQPRIIEQSNILHFKNFSYDGILGVSTLTHASNTLSAADSLEKQAAGFFTGGSNMGMVLKVTGRLDGDKAAEIKQQFIDAMNPSTGSPNSVAVIPGHMDIVPVGVTPEDSQMLQSRQYSDVQICQFFGVDPTKIYLTKDSKYNTVESMQLAWLSDTIAPRFTTIEAELNRKLIMPSSWSTQRIVHDVEDLLKADLDSLANYRLKTSQVGGYTVNEIRERVGTPKFDDTTADVPMVQVNMQPVTKLFIDGKGNPKPDN